MSRKRPPPRPFTIQKLVPGGAGFAELSDGRMVFVEGALPGDRVEVREHEEKAGYLRVTHFELLASGPERVVPPCPIQRECGGCDWMALSRDAQLRHKAELVAEALERTGGVKLPLLPEVTTAGEPLAYRSRIRLHVSARGKVGFYARGTNQLVPVSQCVVVVPELGAAIAELARLPPSEASVLAGFAELELSAPPGAGAIELELVPRDRTDVRADTVVAFLAALGRLGTVRVAGSRGGPSRRYELPGGAVLSVPAGAFTQVNWAVNAALVTAVVDGARRRNAHSFVDLYAGAGNFSVPLARAGLEGVAVELDAAAAQGLASGVAAAGVRCEVLSGDVPAVLRRLATRAARYELVVLDPPRAGAREAIEPLARLAPAAIAYVSCDPVTLARDLREFRARGYELVELCCFDMFPQTHHVETLAWLARAGA